MPKRTFSYAYNNYVSGDDDLRGLIAYALYKRDKVRYLQNHSASHGGQDPSDAAIHDWSLDHSTPEKVALYNLQASQLIEIYRLQEVKKAEPEIRKTIEAGFIGSIHNKVSSLTGGKAFWASVGSGIVASVVWIPLAALMYIGLRQANPMGLVNGASEEVVGPGHRK